MKWTRRLAPALGLGAVFPLTAAPLPDGRPAELSLDRRGYGLVEREGGFLLRRPRGEPVPIARALLVPPGAEEEEEHTYVSSLAYEPEVHAFPVGDGRVGLHFGSYAIQREGSAQAAAGREED
jgi:hypothetical protein